MNPVIPPGSRNEICSVSRSSGSGSYSTIQSCPSLRVSNCPNNPSSSPNSPFTRDFRRTTGVAASSRTASSPMSSFFRAAVNLLPLADTSSTNASQSRCGPRPIRCATRSTNSASASSFRSRQTARNRRLVREDLALLRFLKRQVDVADAPDVLRTQLAVLLAQIAPQRPVPPRRVDQLRLPPPMRRFPVRQHPDVGRDPRVVEDVQRQRDDCLQPVVLDQPAPDVALPLPRIPRKQRRPVVHLRDPAPQPRLVLHLLDHVHQKEHLPVARPCYQTQLLAPVLNDEARVPHPVLPAHQVKVLLPTLPVRRIGEHEVETPPRKPIRRQRRTEPHVVRVRPLPLQQQIGLRNRERLRVNLLPVEVDRHLLL